MIAPIPIKMYPDSRILRLVSVGAALCLFVFLGCSNAQEGAIVPLPPNECNQPYGCSEPGMFVNPNNCNSFHWCYDFYGQGVGHLVRYVFRCGDGLWFDERQMVCNYPENVIPIPKCAACWHSM